MLHLPLKKTENVMNILPTKPVRCPKCGRTALLRPHFFVTTEGLERMHGVCPSCRFTRTYLPLDWEGSDAISAP